MIAQLQRDYIMKRPLRIIPRLLSYAFFEGRPITTRGRWINPLVFLLFSLEKRAPQLRRVKMPIFIIGTGRSGTTILGVLMSMHRDIGFLNEPKALWYSIFRKEDVVGNYSRDEAYYRLDASHATAEVIQNAHRLFGAYLLATLSRRVVDKNPELVFRIPFVRAIFPDARFLFLVRNGWDTCSSIEQWSVRLGKRKAGEIHDWWGVDNRKWKLMLSQLISQDPTFDSIKNLMNEFTKHRDMAAVEWVVTMREGWRQMKESPEAITIVRYEELVEDPSQQLRRIAEFCELEEDKVFLDYAEETLKPAPEHTKFELHPAIAPLFENTMLELGY